VKPGAAILSAGATIDGGIPGARHAANASEDVFRPITNNRTGELDRPLDPASVYQNIQKVWIAL
jgi:hypothetical protein